MSSRPQAAESPGTATLHPSSFEDDFDLHTLFEQWSTDLEASLLMRGSAEALEQLARLESMLGLNPEVYFEGVLQFDGYSNKKIRSPDGKLVLLKSGKVDADIEVNIALIDGVVNGNITAVESVVLESNARVTGQISTGSLSISQGAFFDGDCLLNTAAPSSESIREVEQEEEKEELKHFAVGV